MTMVDRCDEIIRAIDDVLWVERIVRRVCGCADVPTDADLVFVPGVGTCLPMFSVVGALVFDAASDSLVSA